MSVDGEIEKTLDGLFRTAADGTRTLSDEALQRCLSRAGENQTDAKVLADDCYSILLETTAPAEQTGYQDAFRECTEVLREFGLLK